MIGFPSRSSWWMSAYFSRIGELTSMTNGHDQMPGIMPASLIFSAAYAMPLGNFSGSC